MPLSLASFGPAGSRMLHPQQLPERQVQRELRVQQEQQRVLREPQQPEPVLREQPVQQQRKRRR